jgi:peptide/nickel transport system substrate-binding protein
MHRGNPPSFAAHQEATISTSGPMMGAYNNLVVYDQLQDKNTADVIIPELAERWEWQDNGKSLVFYLRKGVKWHDGKPFTSKDVKHTFDSIRLDIDMRVNPRKLWYANVESIDTPDDYTVIFRLKRPQPSLLAMLASGYSPVYPAHMTMNDMRTKINGTGPFKLKEWRPGEYLELEKNENYWVPGRPYLDGIRWVIIKDRATRNAALQAGELDVSFYGEITKTAAETIKKAVPEMVVIPIPTNVNDNILMNFNKEPYNDFKVRRAVSLAIDRAAYVVAVREGGAIVGASMMPAPWGEWGLPEEELKKLPGYGDATIQREEAKKLLAEAGYPDGFKCTMSTRAIALYVDFAVFIIDQLKKIGIDCTLEQVETGVWHPKVTRRDYTIATNLTGIGILDPDANFYENYRCGSPRNYSDYCNPEVDRMMDEESATLDPVKRKQLVWEIQKRLELEGARPVLGWTLDYHMHWPYVRNLIPQPSIYNYGRYQDVWLAPH